MHRHALVGLALVSALAVLPACASRKKKSAQPDTSTAAAAETATAAYYKEEYKDGRFYVFGQESAHDAWAKNGFMPYARTTIGSGPYGATVVYEIDQSWPQLTDWLQQKFEYEHWTTEPRYYAVAQHDGRDYVFGTRKGHDDFLKTHHIPYARTQIGGGAGGKTVVFEIDQHSPAMTDWLEREYSSRATAAPASGASAYYAETMKDGRYYVFGTTETEAKFKQHGSMPYARTFIGAGPGGKTVVLEVDTKDDSLADRLQAEFARRHGLKQ